MAMRGFLRAFSWLMGFLYKKFRKHEINRYQVTYDLLPSLKEGGRLLDVCCGDGDLVFMCRRAKDVLVKLLLASGFQIKQVACSGIFAKYCKIRPSLLSGDLIIKAIKTQ
jgi:predicted membrane protein